MLLHSFEDRLRASDAFHVTVINPLWFRSSLDSRSKSSFVFCSRESDFK